jgi:nicotinamidase-related amidase
MIVNRSTEIDTGDLLAGRPALLVIDMQRDFLDGGRNAYVQAPGIIERVAGLAEIARRAEAPVIFTQELHRASGLDIGRFMDHDRAGWIEQSAGARQRPPCIEGTRGAEFVDGLTPGAEDFVVAKRRQSAFIYTELDLLLAELGVRTLFLTGVCSNVCVLWTTGDAFQRGFHTRVIEDCVGGTSEELHHAALRLMRAHTSPARPVLASDARQMLQEWGARNRPPPGPR